MNESTDETRIRLLLLDEHGLFRASLARFLSSERDFEIAGECGTPAQALEILCGSAVDLVLLDLDLGSEHGNEFISAAKQAGYEGQFLVVAGTPDGRTAAMALKLGATGIFLKSEPPERLVQAIRVVFKREVWVDPKVIQMLVDQLIDQYGQVRDHASTTVLEERERKVLLGILGGLTNKKIGENVGLSESSVKNIVQRLFGKAGVKKRSQLVRVALEGSLGATRNLIRRQLREAQTPITTEAKSKQRRQSTSTNHSSARQSSV